MPGSGRNPPDPCPRCRAAIRPVRKRARRIGRRGSRPEATPVVREAVEVVTKKHGLCQEDPRAVGLRAGGAASGSSLGGSYGFRWFSSRVSFSSRAGKRVCRPSLRRVVVRAKRAISLLRPLSDSNRSEMATSIGMSDSNHRSSQKGSSKFVLTRINSIRTAWSGGARGKIASISMLIQRTNPDASRERGPVSKEDPRHGHRSARRPA